MANSSTRRTISSPTATRTDGERRSIFSSNGTGSLPGWSPRGGGRDGECGGEVVVVVDDSGGGSDRSGGGFAGGGAVDDGDGRVDGGWGGALAVGFGAGAHSGPPGGRSSGVRADGMSNPSR